VQDQISIGDHVDLIGGVRRDRFTLNVDDRCRAELSPDRHALVSRVGVVLKPVQPVSIYASYSRSFLPQSGDQFSSLDVTSAALEPERFDNYELGLKWDIRPTLNLTAAIYQLDRTNTRAADPNDPARTVLTARSAAKGSNSALAARSHPSGRSARAMRCRTRQFAKRRVPPRPGARFRWFPNSRLRCGPATTSPSPWGRGRGLSPVEELHVHQQHRHPARLHPRRCRRILQAHPQIEAQINVENLLNSNYFSSAYNDNNIMPGAPMTVRATVRMSF
jgi:catecholate siderophore receptor